MGAQPNKDPQTLEEALQEIARLQKAIGDLVTRNRNLGNRNHRLGRDMKAMEKRKDERT